MNPKTFKPEHFIWHSENGIATIKLNCPERKNPLTFESYRELRDTFRELVYQKDVKVIIFAPNGGNFSSGGDVHDIIGPLVKMEMTELLDFTRMTGDLVKAIRACPQPVIAAIDGISVGAGAIIPMASDLRIGTADCKTAFLFNKVGLAGCDMGACAILPRIIGQGRASELLFLGRTMSGETMADRIASGPTFANGITKTQLNQEWNMSIEAAIEAEAQAQAICMQTKDFERAYHAFVNKEKPEFEGD
jgi:enoyl-CoA hydratase/carnithine racemase